MPNHPNGESINDIGPSSYDGHGRGTPVENALHFMAAIVEKHQLKMVIRFKHRLDKTLLANGLTNRILNAKSGLKKYLWFRLHVMKKLGSVGRKNFFLIIFFRVLAVLNEH